MTAQIARQSVLLVEDDLLQAQSTAFVLSDAGANVIGPFSNIDEALEALEQTPAQCAVLDLDLGQGMDLAPAQKLRARGVPVVLLTGYGVEELPAELASLPVVEKPFPPGVLVEAIVRILPASSV